MMVRFYVAVFFTFLLFESCFAQNTHNYGFTPYEDVNVWNEAGNIMAFPWVGGLNAAQFNSIELNDDDLIDLVIFDRHGDRLLTFINQNDHWVYRPEFQTLFPEIKHWMILRDYDADGDMDLFTYTTGGIKVFRNEYPDNPRFVQVTDPYITSLQGSIQTNILVTYADYPGIVDLDFDGDLDILTFWGMGSFVEMHLNLSMELYGTADSLAFEKKTYCWGRFAESEESNVLYMDTCVSGTKAVLPEPKHTGSTFLLFDYGGDMDYDLLLGDVDYPGLVLLENGGDNETAFMTAQNWNFPPSSPINMYSFPSAYLLDVDFDGLDDLIISPFDPSMNHSVVGRSIQKYKNFGTAQNPEFFLEQDDFLQQDMIDLGAGAVPVLFDWNGDGLQDIIAGNLGVNDTCFMDDHFILQCEYVSSIRLFLNIGTAQNPEFSLADEDVLQLESFDLEALYPAFGDIDGDGDDDLLIGTASGNLIFAKNVSVTNIPQFEVVTLNFLDLEPEVYSAPAFVDIDNDNDMDLVCGSRNGMLSLYLNNTLNGEMAFDWATDELGGVDVRDVNMSYYGYSTPCFFTNSQGNTELLVGSESGLLFLYGDIQANYPGAFTLLEKDMNYINSGVRTAASMGNINDDAYPDLVVGNYSGGLNLYKGIWPPSGLANSANNNRGIECFPSPAIDNVTVTITEQSSLSGSGYAKCYASDGTVLHEQQYSGSELQLDVSQWPTGICFVQLIDDDRSNDVVARIKVVVVH